ncbi:Uncharacterized protein FWK35_00008927 [Aphis craccivora]|uniref:Uncharacterized protein n=1 Tax=Aphis craccivora TaxID=307492 RepID=A0A6G0ZDW5_APHCR|nr:Uncharacterized protein FWK35_00008927 [Aphis craccivora]
MIFNENSKRNRRPFFNVPINYLLQRCENIRRSPYFILGFFVTFSEFTSILYLYDKLKIRITYRLHINIKFLSACINYERSDFTMMCDFFFWSVYSITSRNNTSISNFGGGFRWKSEYPWCIIEVKVPYEFSNFYEICRKRENLHFSFNLSCKYLKISPLLIIQILTKIRQNHEYLQIILELRVENLYFK